MKTATSTNEFRSRLADLTIRTKLAFLVGLLIAGIAIFIFWYFPSLQEAQQMEAISEKAQSIAAMTSVSIASAIVFEDKEAMKESFDAAKQNKDLIYIVAVDEHDRVLSSYNMAIADSARYQDQERGSSHNIIRDGNIYGATASVFFQNREIGKVFIGLSLESLKAEIAESRATIASVSFAIFLAGVFSVLAIVTIITVPLRKMSQTAQQIAQGNMSERAKVYSNDEVGRLAKTFNLMVDNLSLTHREMKRSEERYRSLFEVNPHPMWVYDVETLAFLDVNEVATVQYGFSKDDFLRMTLKDIRPEEDVADVIKNVETSKDVVQSSGVWRHRRKDGSVIWVDISSHALLYQGREARLVLANDVSERKSVEESLRLAEEKYRSIFENAVVGIFQTTIDGRYITANPTLARMYGVETPEDLMATGADLNRDLYVKSGRRAEFTTLMIQHGAVSGFESQVYRKDRSIIWISVSARAMRDAAGAMTGFEGTAIDITERKRAEESTSRLLGAVEQTDDVVFMTEIDGTITYVNPAFEELYGYTKDEAVGKTARILKSGKYDNGYYERIWRELLLGKSYQAEYINRTKAGDEVFVEAAVSPVYNTENELTGFIAVQRDVTRRKREEEERKSLQLHLAQAQKVESIGTLAGGIAHDFNNILGIILGHVGLLQKGGSDSQRFSSSLGSINTAVNRGAGLVKQILTFARKAEVLFEPIRLSEIVEELKMLQETFPKTITFATNFNGLDPIIEGDRTQLHQTLLNLCVNARDAMPDGGLITIAIEEETADHVRRIFPDARNGQYASVSVTDTGSGMDRKTMQRIFEPFFTTKEVGKGTGLGLAVVYGIVKSHGGCIDVQSEPGVGTTFSLFFPLTGRKEKSASTSEINEARVDGGNKTILVVEDEEMLRSLLESLLISQGYTVLNADDGEKAVEMYREHQNEVAVVVTDIGLPKMSGQDAFMKMKELNPDVKAIIASGYLEPQERADLLAAGAKRVINKPYGSNDILNQIREVIGSA